MAKHRTYSIQFKRQVAQEFLAGETLHALAKRHDAAQVKFPRQVTSVISRRCDRVLEFWAADATAVGCTRI